MTTPLRVGAVAHYLGGRIHVRDLEGYAAAATAPFTFHGKDGGFFVVLRFGALVSIGTSEEEEGRVRALLDPMVEQPEPADADETVEIILDEGASEGVTPDGLVRLRMLDVGRAQVLANALGKSAVLTHYERKIMSVFDRVEGLAGQLRDAIAPTSDKELLREIGETLLMRTRMVGRVEVSEKPDVTWDVPELDRLYDRLAVEFELTDRDRALSRKLELVSDVAGTYLELLDTRTSHRLEWYIILLIAFEIIGVILWEMFRM